MPIEDTESKWDRLAKGYYQKCLDEGIHIAEFWREQPFQKNKLFRGVGENGTDGNQGDRWLGRRLAHGPRLSPTVFHSELLSEVAVPGDSWKEWDYSWEHQLALMMNRTGVNAVILELAVTHDPANSSNSVIEVSASPSTTRLFAQGINSQLQCVQFRVYIDTPLWYMYR